MAEQVMVIGPIGGREYAFGEGFQAAGANVTFTHGGNGGTGEEAGFGSVIEERDPLKLADYALQNNIDLVFIGPEQPLVDGQGDLLRERGIATFGPGRTGVQLEASKAYSAWFNAKYGIRQPDFEIVDDMNVAMAHRAVANPTGYVWKAYGLAGGKGVLLPDSLDEARAAFEGMLSGRLFGDAGKIIVLQRRLQIDRDHPEVSPIYIFDGRGNFTLLPLSQDHKRLGAGDIGPNTGGMGAYTPVPFETDALIDQYLALGEQIAQGEVREGIAAPGTAYVATVVGEGGIPDVIEINKRFGDPETQVVLAALRRAGINIRDLVHDAAHGSLDPSVRGRALGRNVAGAVITVCLAAEGYPDSELVRANSGRVIHGLGAVYEGVTVQHAGTRRYPDGTIRAVGGRVLWITAEGRNIDEAAARAYGAIGRGPGSRGVYFQGVQARPDIAWQARSSVN